MEITEKKLHSLRKALDFDITRYLIVNSCNKLNGSERSDRHANISKTLCKHIFNINSDRHYKISGAWLAVHDYLSDVLTDRMDEVIGFPVYEPLYDVDTYKERFFKVIIKNMKQIETVAKENII